MIQMKKMQYVVASLLAASVFTTAAEAANFNNEVKTQQGVVAGAYDDKHQVVQWLGVPYAQQPTGADRWREAQQAKKHKGILDCTKAAPANIQYNGKKVLGQEGMLTLDIVRPDPYSIAWDFLALIICLLWQMVTRRNRAVTSASLTRLQPWTGYAKISRSSVVTPRILLFPVFPPVDVMLWRC